MSDSMQNQDEARAADRKSPACDLIDLFQRGEGICLGKLAFSVSSLFLRAEVTVHSSLELKKQPRADA